MRQQIVAVWHWLIYTRGTLSDAGQRRARLLAACLCSVLFLLVLALPLTFLSPNPVGGIPPNPMFWLTAATGAVFGLAYAVNRRGRYIPAARLTVGAGFASSWLSLVYNFTLPDADFGSLIPAYLIGSVLVCSLLLDLRATALIALANLAGLLLLGLLIPAFTAIQLADAIVFLLLVSGLVVVSSLIRDQDQRRLLSQSQALAASEERYRSVIAALNEGVILQDAAGAIIACNASAERILGIRGAEMIGQIPSELQWNASHEDGSPFAPGDLPQIQTLRTGKPVNAVVMSLVRPDGNRRWISINSQPVVREGEAKPYAVVVSFSDITMRKEAEDARRQSEERLHAVLDNSTAAIYMKDVQGRYLLINRRYESLFGIERARLIGQTGEQLFPPAEVARYWAQDLRVLQTGQPLEVEEQAGTEAEPRTYISVKFPIRDANGETYAVCSISTDITERKHAERALAAERDLLQSLMDNIPDFVYIKDRDSRLTGFNKAFMRFAGMQSPSEGLGKSDFDFQAPELARKFFAEEQTIINSGQPISDRIEYNPHPDGRPRWLSATKAPLFDKTGAITGIVGISRDVTERRQTEQELEGANARLTAGLGQLEQRTHVMKALNEMSDFLQSCNTFAEAYAVVSTYASRLFPDTRGILYIINASRNLVEPAAHWGAPEIDAPAFHSPDCWALRRGRLHYVTTGDSPAANQLRCDHLRPPLPNVYLCMPLVAQGDTIGVLHVQELVRPAGYEHESSPGFSEAQQQLARTVADSVAQSLANLQLREKLRNQSIRDSLTNLFNRRYLEETLDRELARAARGGTPLSVIMLDIDHFKQFNDSYGHDAGDLLLHELGNVLQASIRAGDIACRFGGEEFTIVFPDASLEMASQRANHIREGVKNLHVEHLGQPLGMITLSLGVATYPQHGAGSDQLLRAADGALYRAKREGRDRVVSAG